MISKFAKALGLNKDMSEDLHLLVMYNQSTDTADRNMFLKNLSEHRVLAKLKSGEIDRKTWEKIPNWVAWVLFAMIDQEGVQFTVESLKAVLRGKAADDEIETAMTSLLQSGQVVRDQETGQLKKAQSLTEAPEEIPGGSCSKAASTADVSGDGKSLSRQCHGKRIRNIDVKFNSIRI